MSMITRAEVKTIANEFRVPAVIFEGTDEGRVDWLFGRFLNRNPHPIFLHTPDPETDNEKDIAIVFHELGHLYTYPRIITSFGKHEKKYLEAEAAAWIWALRDMEIRGILKQVHVDKARFSLINYKWDKKNSEKGKYWDIFWKMIGVETNDGADADFLTEYL